MSHPGREREVFERLLDHVGPGREELLDELTEGEEELRRRVLRLLEAHDRPESLAGVSSPLRPTEGAEAPSSIGPYRILRHLGSGGMGDVYLAEQTEPLRRQVAIKLIKPGMDTREVIARFASESQVLARMTHPGIARVHDAGATERGRPFFVMEYVQGESIVEFCDRRRLSVAERVELVARVARAVQHAHQKGIIHRDLKPSNILVCEEDGAASPRIIDFGIAKATRPEADDRPIQTVVGGLIGTPEYMSPEQARTGALDVDARTDVYSLGVVLYELLTGSVPFELGERSPMEVQRVIGDQDPEAPSQRVSRSSLSSAPAADRGTTPALLSRQLRGDLDAVTLTALQRDRSRRYQTPIALAEDLERFLRDEPVEASPPSTADRLVRFIRRHRSAVFLAALTSVLLVSLVVFHTARLAREREAARIEAERANRESQVARQVTDFLIQLFEVSDPDESRGRAVTAREVLDRGADSVLADLDEQPEVQFELLQTMGSVYLSLGSSDRAVVLLEEAVATGRAAEGVDRVALASAINLLGETEYARGDLDAAERLVREALELRRSHLEPDDPQIALSLNNVGALLRARRDPAGAERFYREALEIRRSAFGERSAQFTQSLNNLAVLLHGQGDLGQAEALYRQTLELRTEVLGEDHPDTLNSIHNLGILLRDLDDLEASEEMLRRTLEARRRVLGNEHPELLETLHGLAATLRRQGREGEADDLLQEAARVRGHLAAQRGAEPAGDGDG